MELLYLCTICNDKTFNTIINESRIKPSVAPYTFDRHLIYGLSEISDLKLDLLSFPMVAAFPNSKIIGWNKRKEKITSDLTTQWLPAVNVHLLKQLTLRVSSYFAIKSWLKKTKGKKRCVMMYSIYYPIARNVVKLCKKYGCDSVAIVSDLPKHAYTNARTSQLKNIISKIFINSAIKVQKNYSGYILLTKEMENALNCIGRNIIIEGIFDAKCFDKIKIVDSSQKRAIMYAGAINKKYGIELLIQAFIELDGDYELWLFGNGDSVKMVKDYANKYGNIKYYGHVQREKVLQYEKSATLLINIRPVDEEFTKYSFPSKTLEYMASGTPLLTTKLPGIPNDYFDYVYTLNDISKDGLVSVLNKIMKKSDYELKQFGQRSADFIRTYKNCAIQAQKIYAFLKNLIANRKEQK